MDSRVPSDWERAFSEIEFDNSIILENIFFQPNSDLSIRLSSLNIFKDDNHKKVEKVIYYLFNIKEADPKEMEFKKN
ncbi:hypothetical protein NCTC15132_02090 [Fusobacterium sp. oral taxon C10]